MAFGSPQDVEVRVDGAWVPGAMLGWRHDDTGGCEAWVQLRADGPAVVAGAGTWVGLTDVRLPEPHLSLAPSPATTAAGAAGAPAPSGRPRRARRHGADGTAEQPVVAPGAAGRHRAPAGDCAGRHRAATAELSAVVPASPGRGEDGTTTAAAAAPEATVVAPAVGAPEPVAPADADPDLLTRPIRLGDLVATARGGRPPVRPSA